jgi:hypothetical protein
MEAAMTSNPIDVFRNANADFAARSAAEFNATLASEGAAAAAALIAKQTEDHAWANAKAALPLLEAGLSSSLQTLLDVAWEDYNKAQFVPGSRPVYALKTTYTDPDRLIRILGEMALVSGGETIKDVRNPVPVWITLSYDDQGRFNIAKQTLTDGYRGYREHFAATLKVVEDHNALGQRTGFTVLPADEEGAQKLAQHFKSIFEGSPKRMDAQALGRRAAAQAVNNLAKPAAA